MDIEVPGSNPDPRTAEYAAKLEWLRREVDLGLAAVELGETSPAGEVFARLAAWFAQLCEADRAA